MVGERSRDHITNNMDKAITLLRQISLIYLFFCIKTFLIALSPLSVDETNSANFGGNSILSLRRTTTTNIYTFKSFINMKMIV